MKASFQEFIAHRFGELAKGSHRQDSVACALEAFSQWRGLSWTDSPIRLGLPDVRPINDTYQDQTRRTSAMVRLLITYQDWAQWSNDRRRRIMARVIIRTVQVLIADLPGLPETIRQQCCGVSSVWAAKTAAKAVEETGRMKWAAAGHGEEWIVGARAVMEGAWRAAGAAAEAGTALSGAAAGRVEEWIVGAKASKAAAWAAGAAKAVARAAAEAAVTAGMAAAWAGRAAAVAAEAGAAGDNILDRTVTLWIEAAEKSIALLEERKGRCK